MSPLIQSIVSNVEQLLKDFGIKREVNLEESRRWVKALKAGKLFFYETQEVEIGLKDIDWSGKHVHHQEWPAQLNRFFWLEHFAAVYRETRDEKLPTIARGIIEDWMNHHSYGADKPIAEGDNTLNLSIRLGQSNMPGWWGTLPDFAQSPRYDGAFVRRMIESTRGQLAYLKTHMTAVGNWRISQLDCMLFCGLVVPGLEEYVPFAARGLGEAFHRQIHEDGSHEEHNPSYHGWMCRVFTNLWRLAKARPEVSLRIDTERVVRMWDYAVYSSTPDGGSAGLHDSGCWRKGPGRISALEGRTAFLREAGLFRRKRYSLHRQPSRYFQNAGQLFLRDSWKLDSMFVTFDATRWGYSHCHLSRNSVNLYAGRRMLLCDPGVFSYEMSDPYAPYGKSTPAHNTVTVGGLSQTEANPDTRHVHVFDDAAVIASAYEGGYYPGAYTWYWYQGRGTGVYGAHDRVLLWIKERGALVFDAIRTDGGGQPYAAHWQFPVGGCTLDADDNRAWTTGHGTNVLVQCLHASDKATLAIHKGEKDPLLGWLPVGRDGYSPAPMLAVEAKTGALWSEMATLLMPFAGTEPPKFDIEAFDRLPGRAYGYRITWPDGAESIIACTPGLRTQVDRSGPLASDGCMAVVWREGAKATRALLVAGMYLELDGQMLINEEKAGTYMRDL